MNENAPLRGRGIVRRLFRLLLLCYDAGAGYACGIERAVAVGVGSANAEAGRECYGPSTS